MQDVVNDLKKNYVDLEESTKLEIQKLTNQILKSHKAILDLEEKSNYLAVVNNRKYMQIWDMNIETANKLVNKVKLEYVYIGLVSSNLFKMFSSDFNSRQNYTRTVVRSGMATTKRRVTEEGKLAIILWCYVYLQTRYLFINIEI